MVPSACACPKRSLRGAARAIVLALLTLALSGCLPNLNLFGPAGGTARVEYSVAQGNTGGFDTSPFATRYVRAEGSEGELRITLETPGRGRTLLLQVNQLGPPSRSCALTADPSAFGCSLRYLQATESSSRSLEATVSSGNLSVSETAERVTFTFEAVLNTPAGGSFSVRGSGEAEYPR